MGMSRETREILTWLARVTGEAVKARHPTDDPRFEAGWEEGARAILQFIERTRDI